VILGFVARLSVTLFEILHSKPGITSSLIISSTINMNFSFRRFQDSPFGVLVNCIIEQVQCDFELRSAIFGGVNWILLKKFKNRKEGLWRPLWRHQEVDNYTVSRSPTLMRYLLYIDWGIRWFVASQRSWRRGMVRFWATCTKIEAFSLQVVSTRKSATKPFQDQPSWWQPNQIHLKAYCDFKMHMSCTLARFGPKSGAHFLFLVSSRPCRL